MNNLVFRNSNFSKYLAAFGAGNLADGIAFVAIPWLATLITRDALLVALVTLAARMPYILFTFPAGVWVDRYDRHNILVVFDVVRLIISLLVVAFTLGKFHQTLPEGAAVAVLSLLTFLFGSAEVIRGSCAQGAVPSIVESKDLEKANGSLMTVRLVAENLIGPLVAGLLIALSMPLVFAVNALAYLTSTLLVFRVKLRPVERNVEHEGMFGQIARGIFWLWRHRVLRQLALTLGVMNILTTTGFVMIVLYSQEVMKLSSVGFGLVMAAAAAGGILGGMLGPKLYDRVGMTTCIRVSIGLLACGNVVVFFIPVPVVVGLTLAVEFFGGVLWNIVVVSYRQREIPQEMFGCVNATFRFFAGSGLALGTILGGVVVASAEILFEREFALRMPFAVAALGFAPLFILTVVFLRFPKP